MSGRKVLTLLACSSFAVGLAATSEVRAEPEPVEYVRVCDAFGSGFFYIPGTETCINFEPSIGGSYIENPSNLGVGTVVQNFGTNELFGAGQADWLGRFGGGVSGQYELGEYERYAIGGIVPTKFLFFDIDIAGGSSDKNGQAQVGGGVSAVGFTFAYRDPIYGTGLIAIAPGFGLNSRTETDNFWGVGSFGYGKTYPLDLDEGYGAIVFKSAPYFEALQYDSTGRADLTFGGVPWNNYYQEYSYDATDTWIGWRGDVAYHWHPSHNWFFSFGIFGTLSYHQAEANLWQRTTVGGGPVPISALVQTLNYDQSNFSIGGGAEFNAAYALNKNIQLGLQLSASILPDVTSLTLPQNPSQQPAYYSQEDIARFFANVKLNFAIPVE